MRLILTLAISLILLVAVGQAQDVGRAVTDNDVNAVANRLFCPVCENIPLDTCSTAACQDWREEIRLMLTNGMNEEEIITNFVERFGDRVVGSPRDPVLRAISMVTPWLVLILAGVVAGMTLLQSEESQKMASSSNEETDKFHDLLERDLAG